jgi:pyruvate dehydrogenase phosphatase
VVRWDRNWVASNEPCEDRSAVDVVPRLRSAKDMGWWPSSNLPFDSSMKSPPSSAQAEQPTEGANRPDGSKDLVMFSIMDGHAGHATSELLSKVLHPTLALGLAGLQAGNVPGQAGWRGALGKVGSWVWGGDVWTRDNVAKQLATRYVLRISSTSSTRGIMRNERVTIRAPQAGGRDKCRSGFRGSSRP